ncbi:formylglycine-generating enzyme family protein [Chromatiaceae bacterium AAb-1]|nr:formylglycine-generating enzyme family protein [Chromatiaceae bacterium AAb-1]
MKTQLSLAVLLLSAGVQATPVQIDGGWFKSPVLLDADVSEIYIKPFRLDSTAVTNADFLQFVQQQPQWQRGQVPAIFADSNYLRHWAEAQLPGDGNAAPDRPVTYVSWFAARAYCEAQGGRLPTLNEWEYVSATIRSQDQISDSQYARSVFGWYSRPGAEQLKAVTSGQPGSTGIYNLHGLVNEWVEDFQLLMTNGDDADALSGSCGDTARFMAEYDSAHYATFLRYQSRSNYIPQNTTSTSGFRCAY